MVAIFGGMSATTTTARAADHPWFAGTEILCEPTNPDSQGDTYEAVLDPADTEVVESSTSNALGEDAAAGGDGHRRTGGGILSPVVNGTCSDQTCFEGLVSDTEDDPDTLLVTWESDIDGVVDVASSPTDRAGRRVPQRGRALPDADRRGQHWQGEPTM